VQETEPIAEAPRAVRNMEALSRVR
jgi:hypothetical protein